MASLSTHVLDSASGGPWRSVKVEVHDAAGAPVADGVSDESGRISALASDLDTGSYRITWQTGGPFVTSVTVTVQVEAGRHYHVPLVASGFSAAVYLGV